MRRTLLVTVAVMLLGCVGVAIATTTQTVEDKKGDSKGPVDIKSVKVVQSGLKLSFTVTAYKSFKTSAAPCVSVFAGRHNSSRNSWAIGCYGKFVSAQGEKNGKLKVSRPSSKSVKYSLDPSAIGSPGKFRWQASAASEGKVFDKAPARPKTFDGSKEGGTNTGDPNAPGGSDEGSGPNSDGTCGPDHVPCP